MVGKNNSTILTVSYGTFSCTLEGFDDSFDMMKAIAEYFRDLAADDRYFGAEPPTPDADMLARIAEREGQQRVEALPNDAGVVLRPAEVEEAITTPEPAPIADPVPAARQAESEIEEDPSDDFFGGSSSGAMLNEDSVAARLARIRAAAAAAPIPAPVSEPAPEAVDPEPVVQELDELPEALAEQIADDLEDALGEGDDLEVSEDDLRDLMEFDGVAEADVVEPELDDEAPAVAEEPDLRSLLNDIQSDDDADTAAMLEGEEFEDDEVEEAQDAPIQARILHVKGAALEEAEEVSGDEMFGYDDEAYEEPIDEIDTSSLSDIFDKTEEDVADEPASSLSDEEEADLMRELAEVEADEDEGENETAEGEWDDLLDVDAEAVIADEEHLFTSDPEEALASAQDLSSLLTDKEADDEVDRLMAETETQMSEPDNSRRRTMMSHLKAAFASKKADKDAGLDEDSGNDSEPYANDLAMSVKPRRPILGSARGAREVAQESAPLRLVAEQKVVPDENRAEPAARPTLVKPVRPRRVQTGNAALAEDVVADAVSDTDLDGPQPSFEDFVTHMGVEKLPEMLEAAVSYITFVVGLEKFSRPQVMTLVREELGDDYTREDGLRAFGQLLREGKIIRLEGGRFTVSDGIGYQPAD